MNHNPLSLQNAMLSTSFNVAFLLVIDDMKSINGQSFVLSEDRWASWHPILRKYASYITVPEAHNST